MYISIDMENCKLLCKHPNFEKCWNYSIINKGDNFYVMSVLDINMFYHMTDLELQMLYINLTDNMNGCIKDPLTIKNIIAQYIMEMPETIIQDNVNEQMQYCIDNNLCGERFYVLNSSKPSTKQLDLWCNIKKYDPALENIIELHKSLNKDNFVELCQSDFTAHQQPAIRNNPKADRLHSEGQKTRVSGACARIWELCDYAYNNVTYENFEEFKTDMRNTLKGEGINPSTISVQFSKWRKERLSQ